MTQTPAAEIVEELRFLADSRQQMGYDRSGAAMDCAATEIEALRAREAELQRRIDEAGGLDEKAVEQIARKAMFGIEVARTGVTKPANGSAPYSWVKFHSQRVTFSDGEWTLPQHQTAGTEKAAAYAQSINSALFELAKAAVHQALASIRGEG